MTKSLPLIQVKIMAMAPFHGVSGNNAIVIMKKMLILSRGPTEFMGDCVYKAGVLHENTAGFGHPTNYFLYGVLSTLVFGTPCAVPCIASMTATFTD